MTEIIPGQTWRIFFSEGNLNNKTVHIRAVVDEDHIVYRSWSKRKQRWIYHIDHEYLFELYQEQGHMKLTKETPCKK